ncbi:hypothetical protein [Candidatus Avelusimicrobium faecicola]|uniref:hypothetical protein n=1 Tax=Candidatus Avelusimicrobium faecicola TaxID=3416205 RepID=UPI003D141CF2
MGIGILILLLAAGAGYYKYSRTRTARLRAWSKEQQALFEPRRERLITALNADKLEFFRFHTPRFFRVCTLSNNAAFMRLADAFGTPGGPAFMPDGITVLAAEFRTRSFPTLKIAPRPGLFAHSQYPAVKTNIAEIDRAYALYTPDREAGKLLTPFLIRLLKTRTALYLETFGNAVVYHESRLLTPQECSALHSRVLHLTSEWQPLSAPQVSSPKTAQAPAEDAVLIKAQSMLNALAPHAGSPAPARSKLSGAGGIILLLLVLAVPVVAWLLLKNLPH